MKVLVNFLFWYTAGVSELRVPAFIFTMLSKLLDLGMIYFFYQYMKRTLGFKGKLAVASVITAILIIRSENPKGQKMAGLTFIREVPSIFRPEQGNRNMPRQ